MTNCSEGNLMNFEYRSCKAEVLVDDGIASIMDIHSTHEGEGDATECIKNIEQYAISSKLKEIWFPTVLNVKLAIHLIKTGYKEKNVGKHPQIDEEVIAYVKELST